MNLNSVLEVFLQWTPVVDNVDLFDQPIHLLASGAVEPVPMIVVSILQITIVSK